MSNPNVVSVSEILRFPIQTQLAAFFNLEQSSSGDFLVISRYSRSKYAPDGLDLGHQTTAENLSRNYGMMFIHNGGNTVSAKIKNDRKVSLEDFRISLFNSIEFLLSEPQHSDELDITMATALWVFRGSWDGKKLYAVDPKDDGQGHYERILHLLKRYTRIPVNTNERNANDPREKQLRVDCQWLASHLLGGFTAINPYKAQILRESYLRQN